MPSQVIFKIDSKLKEQAMKKAQREGLPLALVLKFATQAYVSGLLNVELAVQPRLNAQTRTLLERELKEIRKGKNLSPGFTTAKQASHYLRQT